MQFVANDQLGSSKQQDTLRALRLQVITYAMRLLAIRWISPLTPVWLRGWLSGMGRVGVA